jgi:peptidoglycan/LPS O-acetylase OafA/YrhL
LPTLDGWRAVAIIMVVLSHSFTTESETAGGPANLLLFRLGTFGVLLFFAISGFLICTRLLVEKESTGRISLRSFYIRRVFRILPAAYVYLAAVAVLTDASWHDLAGAAFFYCNYLPSESWFTGHFWSLAMEEHFYLLWPPLLASLSTERALWAAAALAVGSILFRYQSGGLIPFRYSHSRLDSFMLPCILAILLANRQARERFAEIMSPGIWLLVLAVFGAGIAAAAAFPAWREPQRVLQSAVLPVLVATTVLRPTDFFARILSHPALEWLGRTSYSIYLWQQVVFGFAPARGPARMAALPFLILLILVLAAASRRWIEEPTIAWGRVKAGGAR